MRKVKFKNCIPQQYSEIDKYSKKVVAGTGKFQDDFEDEGVFHQWGISYDEFEAGPGNYTVALVELEDGTIEQVLPGNIKFIEPCSE